MEKKETALTRCKNTIHRATNQWFKTSIVYDKKKEKSFAAYIDGRSGNTNTY